MFGDNTDSTTHTYTHTCHHLTTGHLDSIPEAPAAESSLTTNKSPERERERREH